MIRRKVYVKSLRRRARRRPAGRLLWSALRGAVAALALALAAPSAAQWYDPDGPGVGEDWQYRVPIALPGAADIGSTIVIDVDFDQLLTLAGVPPASVDFDENSPRVVRPNVTLAAMQEFTDVRFGGLLDATDNAQGELRFILDDLPAAGTYYLYFDVLENGAKSANPQPPINGHFEHSAGTVPTSWTQNNIRTGGNERNLVQTSTLGSNIGIGGGCNTGGATVENSPNNNGVTATGSRWHLLGYREFCEDGGSGVEQVQLIRNFLNPTGAARGEFVFFFHLQGFDGIETSANNYDFIRVMVNGATINHTTMNIDNTILPTLRIRNIGFGRPSFSVNYLDFSWRRASLDMTQFPPGPTSVTIEMRHSSADEDYRTWIKVDDVEWAVQPGTLGTPEVLSQPSFVINHDNYGIHCQAETITVDLVDANSGNPLTNYSEAITLDTQTARGSWSLVTGGGGFNDATANDGIATYTWPLGESQAVFSLSYPEGTPSFDIDAFQSSDTSVRDDDSEGLIEFSPSGFTLTASALSNPPPATIAPFDATQIAATAFTVHLAAFGQTPTDPTCGVIENYAGSKPLQFWFDYVDPVTGTRILDVDGTPAATSEAGSGAQAVNFVNGQAAITAFYKDVGLLQISVKDASSPDPDLPTGIRGATAQFVSRPARFEISAVSDATGTIPNPQAADENGGVFIAAGAPFRLTVTALDAEDDATPNYGREGTPESVRFDTTLVAPAGGVNPPLSATLGLGAFVAGSASGTDFTWPEVGILTLTPAVADADYLGAGDVSGSVSSNVGRFVPDRFETSLNLPLFETACTSGNFSYVGQPFDYAVAPVVTATAVATGGTTTQNYRGAYFKLSTTTLQNRMYQSGAGPLDTSALPPVATDPAVSEVSPGVAQLVFSAGGGLAYDRSVPIAPFAADIELSIDVIDDDGIAASANPVTFGAGPGIGFDAGDEFRYGRLRLANAVGSEVVDLAVPMLGEYFGGAAQGFVSNSQDACSDGISLSLSAFTDGLGPGETCAGDTGSPGESGIGCAAAAPPAQQYSEPPAAGDFNLNMAAPGEGNQGSATITASVPDWLRFDWDLSVAGDEDPSAQITFGIFPGAGRRIYAREVY